MNTDEGVELGKGGFKIFLVILVVGAVLGLAYFGYNKLNAGQSALSDRMDGLANSAFVAYDGQQVKGDQVLAAIKNFAGQNVTILIAPRASTFATYSAPATTMDCNFESTATTGFYYVGVTPLLDADAMKVGKVIRGKNDNKWYVTNDSGADPSDSATGDVTGTIYTEYANWNQKALSDSKNPFYVQTAMTYYSELLYDPTTGGVVGAVFIPNKG